MSVSHWLVGALLAFGAPGFAPACAQEEQRVVNGPDFSKVTTKLAAERLVSEGRLVRIHVFPTELGGPDEPHNISYTTPEAAEAREMLIGTLRRFADEGLIDRMTVEPDYRADSFVPTRIRFEADNSRGGKPFGGVIEVW